MSKKRGASQIVISDAASLGTKLTATLPEEYTKWHGSSAIEISYKDCGCHRLYLMLSYEDTRKLGKFLMSLKENDWDKKHRLNLAALKRRNQRKGKG